MPITNEQIKKQKHRAQAEDSNVTPKIQIARAKRNLKEYGFANEDIRIGKRVAKKYMLAPDATPEVRKAAISLYNAVLAQSFEEADQLDDELDAAAATEEISADSTDETVPLFTIKKDARSREQQLADSNKFWNAKPVPQKWLRFDTPEDVIVYGIPDLINGPEIYYVDDTFSFYKRVLNPLYVAGYRAWKARRFPYGLPNQTSSWRFRYENRFHIEASPVLRAHVATETPIGGDLRSLEYSRGEVARWEEPYCSELYFEIVLNQGDKYVVMMLGDHAEQQYHPEQPLAPIVEDRAVAMSTSIDSSTLSIPHREDTAPAPIGNVEFRPDLSIPPDSPVTRSIF